MDCVPGHPNFIGWCSHGRLIVASPPYLEGHDPLEDHLISQQRLGFRYLYSMATYLEQRGVSVDIMFSKKFPRYHLIEVPLQNVFNVINGLYLSLRDSTTARIDSIEPDLQLNISAPQVRIGTNFSLTAGNSSHKTYKS